MRFGKYIFCSLLILLLFPCFASATTSVKCPDCDAEFSETHGEKGSNDRDTVKKTRKIVDEVINASYPELLGVNIEVKSFRSRTDFFRSQFSISRFLTFRRLKYFILVNPKVFTLNAPAEGLRAIIAHELAHVRYFVFHNRYELLGLVRLLSGSFITGFERGADLDSIKRGYGAGLIDYRSWLYQNIPSKTALKKRRDYFSPDEIELMSKLISSNPSLIDCWTTKIPRSLTEISNAPTICRLTPKPVE